MKRFNLLWLVLVWVGLAACNAPAGATPTLAQLATIPTLTPSILAPSPLPVVPTFTPQPTSTTIPQPILAQPTVSASPFPLPTPLLYTVVDDDTLSGLAARFGVTVDLIVQVNPGLNPDLLTIGQLLIIPPALANDSLTLPVHYVREGETLSSIAAQYGITVLALQQANPTVKPEALVPGQPLLVPISLGEVHWTVSGDTLGGISSRYGVSIDSLLQANTAVLDLNNPDFVPAGVLLTIPQEQVAEGYDCSSQPARSGVITYIIANGEKLFCLGRKFGVSVTTLLYANPHIIGENGVQDGVEIVVPPGDGAIYQITANDVSQGVALSDLMLWYGLSRFEDVHDWAGNPVTDPLPEGLQLFLANADLLAGPFISDPLVVVDDSPVPPVGGATPGSSGDVSGPIPTPPAGNTPVGALRPANNPWSGEMTSFDTGYCGGVSDGSGWSGSLVWPVGSTQIHENRGFRPGHPAIDIDSYIGASVSAAASGEVIWAGFSRWGGGNMVVLAHGGSWQTHYAHLDTVLVSCGQFVGQGQLIGTVGQSGSSSFPHLHLELRYGGFSYDPLLWLP